MYFNMLDIVSGDRGHRGKDGSPIMPLLTQWTPHQQQMFIVQPVGSMDGFGPIIMPPTLTPFLLPMAITRIRIIELSYVRHCAQSSKCFNSFNPHDNTRK